MAQNKPIILRYGGNIIQGQYGIDYAYNQSQQPAIISPNPNMNYDLLCSEIYRITEWPVNRKLIINARLPIATGDTVFYYQSAITNDAELDGVANYIFSSENTYRVIELYLEYEDNDDIETSIPGNTFDSARVCNSVFPDIDDDDEEEYEEYDDDDDDDENDDDNDNDENDDDDDDEENDEEYDNNGENEITYVYSKRGMASVGTFGNPTALEFEDVSMTENARADMELGINVSNDNSCVDLYIGQTFITKEALIDAVNLYCVVRHREILVDHSGKEVYTVKCRFKNAQRCPWRLHASVNKSGIFEVKRITDYHTCVNTLNGQDNKQLSSSFIAGLILGHVREDLAIKPMSIIQTILLTHEYTIKYPKAWRAKQKALQYLFGSWKESYARMWPMLLEIQNFNPGTYFHFNYGPRNQRNECEFDSVFWAFGPSIQCFQHCKPVITVDGTFLTGKYQGVLLLAVATDADNRLFPIAFGLVERERNDTWEFFFAVLRSVFKRRGLCVISDRHAGIVKAMTGTFEWAEPNAYHRWCMRHFCANFVTSLGDKDAVPLLQQLIMQHTDTKFKKIMKTLHKKNDKAQRWLEKYDKTKWCLAFDEGGRRWGTLTSNNAEVMNSVFKGMRALPVSAIVLETFYKSNAYMVRYRAEAAAWELAGKKWVDYVQNEINRYVIKANRHRVVTYHAETGIYSVTTGCTRLPTGRQKGGNTYRLNLTTQECSCRKPQIYHFPCSHIIAVCAKNIIDYEQFISPYYSVKNLVRTYEPNFFPIRDNKEWPQWNGRILYPGDHLIRKNAQGKTKRGKRRSKRIHNDMDIMDGEDRRKTCSICKQKGHTKATCARRSQGRGRGRGN